MAGVAPPNVADVWCSPPPTDDCIMLPPANRPRPPCSDRPEPGPGCTHTPFTRPELTDDDTGNDMAPICGGGGGGGQAAERCANGIGLPGAVAPLTALKSPSLEVDSGVDEFDLS